jgi:hypothetical protein
VRGIAAPLAREFVARSLGFIVSIKDPYAWMVSLARYAGWTNRALPPGGGERARVRRVQHLLRRVARAGAAQPGAVRYEELLADLARTLHELDAKFALRRGSDTVLDLRTEADAAVWDHAPMRRTR